ncbi:MAG: hypothetical protein U5R49_00715 [Deltaproteobacteria bacterium]|nr:hypothetical protein [Deltaproteobacteria bacterium]
MTTAKKQKCFGSLDEVFPMGPEGLREVVPACFECPQKTDCLKAALKTEEGVELRSQILDRTPATGLVGRIRRWSEKKSLSRLKNGQGGDP